MFCSECGAAVTPEMNHCHNCGARTSSGDCGRSGATVAHRAESDSHADMINKALLGMGVFMIVSTFMAWYRVSINMGDASVDALANFITRLLPSYTGVNTYYGIAAMAIAFAAIICVVCRRYTWAAVMGVTGVALAMVAMFVAPDFVALNYAVSGGGDSNVMELMQSGLGANMLPSEVRHGAAMASGVLDAIYDYVAVRSCFGLTVYAVTSAAFAVLSALGVKRSE